MITLGKEAIGEMMEGVLSTLGMDADVDCYDRDINRASMNVKGALNDKPFEGKMHIIGDRLVIDIPALKEQSDYFLPIAMALLPEAIKLAKGFGKKGKGKGKGSKKKGGFGKFMSKLTKEGPKLATLVAAGLKAKQEGKPIAEAVIEEAQEQLVPTEEGEPEEAVQTPEVEEEEEGSFDFDKVIESTGKFVKNNGLSTAIEVLDNFIADEVDFDDIVSQLLDD